MEQLRDSIFIERQKSCFREMLFWIIISGKQCSYQQQKCLKNCGRQKLHFTYVMHSFTARGGYRTQSNIYDGAFSRK